MTVGGLAQYNPNLNGFVENNNPTVNELAGVMDVVERRSDGYIRNLHDLHLHISGESGAYGVGWSSIASNLPDTPAGCRSVLRINTDESNAMRLYSYNHEKSSWDVISSSDVAIPDHNALSGLNAGVDYEHITQTQKTALHTIFSPGLVTAHSDVTNAGSGLIITDVERTALHAQVTTLTHTALTGKNDEANVKHLTDSQISTLHTIYNLTKSSVDALQITELGTVTIGNIDSIANYIANTDTAWNASRVSQAEAEAGTETIDRKWTAQRVKQAIDALGVTIPDHNALGGLNAGDTYEHITQIQKDALHSAITTLTHTSLTGKNSETNIKHLTDAQITALHDVYTSGEVIDDIEAVANAPIATDDSLIFKDVTDGVLKQDLVSDLLALVSYPNHNALGGLNDGTSYEHITQTQKTALHDIYVLTKSNVDALAITEIGTVTVGNIDSIANYISQRGIDDTPVDAETVKSITSNWAYDHQNSPTDIRHLTDTQISTLHDAITTLTHTALTGKNDETNVKHLTDAQVTTLHTIYSNANAVDAIESVANAPIATDDSLIFKDVTDGVLKQDLVSDLLALISHPNHNALGGLNDGTSYEHITQTQKDALHTIYNLTKSNVDALAITEVGTITVGNIDSIANYIANTDAIADVSSKASGDVFYWTTSLQRLAKGSDTQILTLAGGVPTWAAGSSGGASTLDDLNDVTITGGADKHALMNNGSDVYVNRLLIEDDISDFGSYLTSLGSVTGHTDVTNAGSGLIITNDERTALHAQVTTLTHTVLTGKNSEADIQHLTASQISALHNIYSNVNAVDAIEAIGTATSVTGDWMIFSDAGVLKRQVLSGLNHSILSGLGGKFTNANAVDAIEAVGDAVAVLADKVIFSDNGVLKRESFTDIKSLINTDVAWSASTVGQTEAEAGTATTTRKWTAQRVKQAIDALASGTDYDPDLAIGSGNSAWMPCAFMMGTLDKFTTDSARTIKTIGTGFTSYMFFSVPLSTNRGGKALYIKNTRVILADADSGDYITTTYIAGVNSSGSNSIIATDTTNYNSIGTHTFSRSATNVSGYSNIIIACFNSLTTAGELEIRSVEVEYYYV